NVVVVQGDVGRAHGSAVTRIEGRVPLLVLVSETNDRQITLLEQRLGADGIHLRGLMITPEAAFRLAQKIPGGIAGLVVGIRRGKLNGQASRFGAGGNLFAPVCMDFTG